MIFLSAQPDDIFMKWQLEVQLVNFRKHNICSNNIHVLIGYNPKSGINPLFLKFFKEFNCYATFYTYQDTRTNKSYIPSIRPHIIKKHFISHPNLSEENIFYHDADIIFRELPDFEGLCEPNDDNWYLSDTTRYTSANLLISTSRILFHEMCNCIDIDPRIVEKNDNFSGGAQYLMKHLNYQFWNKVESDCTKLYTYLRENKERFVVKFCEETGKDRKYFPDILPWCTDMWVMIWNAFTFRYNLRLSEELEFCWPTDNINKWYKTKILHNAGVDKTEAQDYFYKLDFKTSTPYNVNFSYVDETSCSSFYVQAIKECFKELRADLRDVTFVIPVRIDSDDRKRNLNTVINYLTIKFKTNIILLEADEVSKVDTSLLTKQGVTYIFKEDISHWFHRTKYINEMISVSTTKIIAIYDTDVIIPEVQILEAAQLIRDNKCQIATPYSGEFVNVKKSDNRELFEKKFDVNILSKNTLFKPRVEFFKSMGGAVIIEREAYIKAGMENEGFYKWGPEDLERVKRMEILGNVFKRVPGPLYHLNHVTAHNSLYDGNNDFERLMENYINITSMTKDELLQVISGWKCSQRII